LERTLELGGAEIGNDTRHVSLTSGADH